MCTSSTSRQAMRVLETYAQFVVLTTLASSWLLRNTRRERYAHWVCTGLHRGTIARFTARCPPSRGLRAHLYRERTGGGSRRHSAPRMTAFMPRIASCRGTPGKDHLLLHACGSPVRTARHDPEA